MKAGMLRPVPSKFDQGDPDRAPSATPETIRLAGKPSEFSFEATRKSVASAAGSDW